MSQISITFKMAPPRKNINNQGHFLEIAKHRLQIQPPIILKQHYFLMSLSANKTKSVSKRQYILLIETLTSKLEFFPDALSHFTITIEGFYHIY